MKERNTISPFSALRAEAKSTDNDILNEIIKNKNTYPLAYELLVDTSTFCEKHFSNLLENIKREKRLLEFDTPNRIKVSHEYTVSAELNESGFYYLFTPSGRLDWLKIYFESERVSIADKSYVKKQIGCIIRDELTNLCDEKSTSHDDLINTIYNNLTGLPCFVEFNYTSRMKEQLSYLLVLEFFESIKPIGNNINIFSKIFVHIKKFFSPIIEKDITYSYKPISPDANSWLYLNAPKNFELSSEAEDKYDIDISQTQDPEIASYVIKSNGQENRKIFNFSIFIKVPMSLKVWYLSLYYVCLMSLIIIGLYFIDKQNIFSSYDWLNSLCITNDFFARLDKSKALNICVALMAGIIATRGWLIVEETVLKNITIKYTLMFVVFSLLSFFMMIN